MGTADKPQISILMATYQPRMDWLKEQLLSLNAQTYPNLKLFIRDDASDAETFDRIRELAKECITAFPFTIAQNAENLGSNRTFELLTEEADGDYFAYCDQDDIWLPEKLSVLQDALDDKDVRLACSDMYVIDADSKTVADSITKVHRTIRFASGPDLAKGLLFHNFVSGCTMLVRSEDAKAAVPFCPYYVHDQYLAICCADKGSIVSIPRTLIRYRIHQSNQTAPLTGVSDKQSYQTMRIELPLKRLEWLDLHLPMSPQLQQTVSAGIEWAEARLKNWKHQGGAKTVWKYRAFSPIPSLFELSLKWLPDSAFKRVIALARKI